MTLERFFTDNPKIALGFSGGVDSSYLLYAAKKYGADVKPFFIKTLFQPDFELEDAKRIAEFTGVQLEVIEVDILTNEAVRRNDERRCYYCKTALFGLLKETAAKHGYKVLIDGSNASDDEGDRPGMKALIELEVLSPLRAAGLTKDDIRKHSKEAGLFTWNKPAYACLATRMPANTEITENNLKKAEKAEEILFSMGFTDFRVRILGENARIQIPSGQMEQLIAKREEILERFSNFAGVLLDLAAR